MCERERDSSSDSRIVRENSNITERESERERERRKSCFLKL